MAGGIAVGCAAGNGAGEAASQGSNERGEAVANAVAARPPESGAVGGVILAVAAASEPAGTAPAPRRGAGAVAAGRARGGDGRGSATGRTWIDTGSSPGLPPRAGGQGGCGCSWLGEQRRGGPGRSGDGRSGLRRGNRLGAAAEACDGPGPHGMVDHLPKSGWRRSNGSRTVARRDGAKRWDTRGGRAPSRCAPGRQICGLDNPRGLSVASWPEGGAISSTSGGRSPGGG